MTARVGVLGYGVIGKRLADAVALQDDMSLVGVAGLASSFSLRDAHARGLPVYVCDVPRADDPAVRFGQPRGNLEEMLARCDVLLDCTPGGVPEKYRAACAGHPRLVTIVQGGEKHSFAGTSFNAFANYDEAAGKKLIRVISCSSTGLTRMVYALDTAFGLVHAFATLIRRAADPGKRSKNPINALTPVLGQSHHAPDVRTVLPHLHLYSLSVDSSTTFGHVLTLQADLQVAPPREQVLEAFASLPRLLVGTGPRSTAELAEYYQDLGRPRRDRPEVFVWEEGVRVLGNTVWATFSVHMESITIPETIDCIRAALGLEANRWRSVWRTDRALGIAREAACYERRIA